MSQKEDPLVTESKAETLAWLLGCGALTLSLFLASTALAVSIVIWRLAVGEW